MLKIRRDVKLPAEFYDDLVNRAADAKEQPSPPPGGIPKQWLPFWIRWPIRLIVLPFVFLDIWMQKLAALIVSTPYKRTGGCKQRGNCCHYILIPKPKSILSRIFFFWSTQINGFYLRDGRPVKYEEGELMIMGCRYLKKDGRCGCHKLRPTICRKWPIIHTFGQPQILRGCGYHIEPKNKDEKENKLHVIQ